MSDATTIRNIGTAPAHSWLRRVAVFSVAAIGLVFVASSCGDDTKPESASVSALRSQLRMASDGQFGRLWESMHPAQQALITKDAYIECSAKKSDVDTVIRSVKDEYEEEVTLPGTDVKATSTALTVEVASGIRTATTTVHEFNVDGEWRFAVADPSEYDPATC